MKHTFKLAMHGQGLIDNSMINRPIRSRKMIERSIIFEGYSPRLHLNSTEETLWSFIRNSRKYNDTAHDREPMTYKTIKESNTEGETYFEIISQ